MSIEEKIKLINEIRDLYVSYGTNAYPEEENLSRIQPVLKFLKEDGIRFDPIIKRFKKRSMFWAFIKGWETWAERRVALWELFEPIIDEYESTLYEADKIKNLSVDNVKKHIRDYLKVNNSIKIDLGYIEELRFLGEGANGVVYQGKLFEQNVAIKFLADVGKNKLNRFKAEFFNVKYHLSYNYNIVNLIDFSLIKIGENTIIPCIVMEKYDSTLKFDKDSVFEDKFYIFKSLLVAIHKSSSKNIIHRDIKPENILISNKRIVLSDFGIAYYNPEYFELTGGTKKGDRLGNYNFSAPEQAEKANTPHVTMDIFALGQIVYYIFFGVPFRGTGIKKIEGLYKGNKKAEVLDKVINKCLSQMPSERFQNTSEIINYIKEFLDKEGAILEEKSDLDFKKKTQLKEQLLKSIHELIFYSEETDYYGNYDPHDEQRFKINKKLDMKKSRVFISSIEEVIKDNFFIDTFDLNEIFNKFGINYTSIVEVDSNVLKNLVTIKNELIGTDLIDNFYRYITKEINRNFEQTSTDDLPF